MTTQIKRLTLISETTKEMAEQAMPAEAEVQT